MPDTEEKVTDAQRVAEEYRNNAAERLGESRARTADSGDADFGWTAQAGTGAAEADSEARGPQMFTEEQLPDPAVAKAAGLAPQVVPPSQILSGDEAFAHPRGPEPGEAERAEKRAAVAQRLEDNQDTLGDDLDVAAVNEKATSAHGRALQARAQKQGKSEGGRQVDPEGVQADSKKDAEARGNQGGAEGNQDA